MVPQFLVIGHMARDLQGDGYLLGGTAAYASLTAQRLGLQAAALTCSREGSKLVSLLSEVQVVNVPSDVTTTFENVYFDGKRRQRLLTQASVIGVESLPNEWKRCSIVLLGPIMQDVDPRLARAFPNSLIGVSPQGWMRRRDDLGHISPTSWNGEGLEDVAQVIVLGEEDLPQGFRWDGWLHWVPVLIITQGGAGARMRWESSWYAIPVYPTHEVDPTGAGDVFAAAYLVRYHETNDLFQAALFASCAASFSIEAPGLVGIPTRAQVERRLRRHAGLTCTPL